MSLIDNLLQLTTLKSSISHYVIPDETALVETKNWCLNLGDHRTQSTNRAASKRLDDFIHHDITDTKHLNEMLVSDCTLRDVQMFDKLSQLYVNATLALPQELQGYYQTYTTNKFECQHITNKRQIPNIQALEEIVHRNPNELGNLMQDNTRSETALYLQDLETDDVSKLAKKLVYDKRYTSESVLVEISEQLLVPCLVRNQFMEIFRQFDNIDNHELGHDIIGSVNVCVPGQSMDKMTTELLTLMLPARYRSSTISLKIMLGPIANVLFGCSTDELQKIENILLFAFVKDVTHHTVLLAKINTRLKEVSTDLIFSSKDRFLHELEKQGLFVLYLETIRQVVPKLENVTVGSTDNIPDNVKQTITLTSIPTDTIYCMGGQYYVRTSSGKSISSNDFRKIIMYLCKMQ